MWKLRLEEAKRMKHFNIPFPSSFVAFLSSALGMLTGSFLELFYLISFLGACFHLDDEFLVCFEQLFIFIFSFRTEEKKTSSTCRALRSHAN